MEGEADDDDTGVLREGWRDAAGEEGKFDVLPYSLYLIHLVLHHNLLR